MKTLLFLLFPLQVIAQDLTGIWSGYLEMGDSKLPYELAISKTRNGLNGYSQLTFTFNGVDNVGIKTMEMKMKSGSIEIEDGELVYDNYTTAGRRVKLYATLAWVGKDMNMTLAGTFATRSMDMRLDRTANSFKGTVFLKRKNATLQTKLMSKLDEMGLSNGLSFIKPTAQKEEKPVVKTQPVVSVTVQPAPKESLPIPRKIDIIRRITFASDSITLNLYDNGEVDGDTVSVLLNGNVIMPRVGLTTKAVSKTIPSSLLGDSAELIMFAENLGRIPPNSGLLIIQSGYERYQVRFSGDLENSSSVILKKRRLPN